MLITQLKPMGEILRLAGKKAIIIVCEGCNEVYFPETEACAALKTLLEGGYASAAITTGFACNPENLALQLQQHMGDIEPAGTLLVFSCGVGVQTIARKFVGKRVLAACDTFPLPGFQGLAPLEYDCGQCGECHLSGTCGICPITTCSKSLLNGQCGGAKNGKCEIDGDIECGWELIYKKLEESGQLGLPRPAVKLRNFAI